MGLDKRYELRIDGNLVLEIRVHQKTDPDAVADLLEATVSTIREGVEAMMTPGDSITDDSQEPPPVEWRYFNAPSDVVKNTTKAKLIYLPTNQLSTAAH